MVIIMFNPSALDLPRYDKFMKAFNAFMSQFTVRLVNGEKKYTLHTFNDVEKRFYLMEDEARKIMDDPKAAKIVSKTYLSKDFMAAVEAAESCGLYLSIPDLYYLN